MTALHIVAGLIGIAIGAFMILRRDVLPLRKPAASRAATPPPTLWVYLGTMLIVVGLLQLLLAVL